MKDDAAARAADVLKDLESQDPAVQESLRILGDAISVGNISGAGVAIGRNIRLVVNQFNLPAEAVGALLEARNTLSSAALLDTERYQLTTLLSDKTKDFVGREYVYQAIEQFLGAHANGYYVIEGDPGMGKSAILAEYVRRTGCISHFNVRAQGITTPAKFLESICSQLIVDYGLSHPTLPVTATQDGSFLAALLREVSSKLEPGERLVIAVDALDEVDLGTHTSGANILYLPAVLPSGVFFIMTRRQVEIPLVVQSPQSLLNLMDHRAENRGDVEFYLHRKAQNLKIKEWIARQDDPTEGAFVTNLADLSENNFMYLRCVLPQIEIGVYRNYDWKDLPSGLKGYYEDHWDRMGMKTKPLPLSKIRIIYILCEALQPVSARLISEFASNQAMTIDQLTVQETLDEWEQFIHEQTSPEGKLYSIYHTSFRDFLHLKDIVQAAGVTIPDINALIADNLWDSLYGEF